LFLNNHSSPSRRGWALLLLGVLAVAAVLRFWQLGEYPAGLYRDEAFNGLDALGVLEGNYAIFFTANNGREPLNIYLTAVAIALFGRSVLAIRLAAAVAGTLTTGLVYLLAREWFGTRTGLFAAWLWAVTLWTVHLSRIGLRVILLAPCLALAFWLGTMAYRRQRREQGSHGWLWLLAGLAYGLGFYTYLAVRFTPLLLLLVFLYLLWQRGWRRLWPGVAWFVGGTAVILFPLALFYLQQPEMLVGRSSQVSIFNPDINNGDLWGVLAQQVERTAGLFLWRGDTILRHNPAGRPLFDPLLAIPFLIGLGWCIRSWRRPAAAVTLLWIGVMSAVTLLAEDAPHFLRAAGILPAVLFLPAIGLNGLWEWERIPATGRQLLVIGLLVISLMITVWDYRAYAYDPETALLFEAAATELAEQLGAEEEGTAVYLDRWFWDEATQKGWPSIPFLADLQNVQMYRPETGLPPALPGQPVSIYAWKFGDLNFVPQLITPPALVTVQEGSLARGDLEAEAYPLYIRYHAEPLPTMAGETVNFGDQVQLKQGTVTQFDDQTWPVDLYWEAETAVNPNLIAFVQLVDAAGIIAQQDLPPGAGLWLADWWRPGLVVHEQRILEMARPTDPTNHRLIIGIYDSTTGERLPVLAEDGEVLGDSWEMR
jgi:4-amino-4-deoxy-L-arabinose transferase-like glycosyltransferase